MSDISKVQESTEAWALTVAQYYTTLRRENVPDELLQALTLRFQDTLLQQAFNQQTIGRLSHWLHMQQKKH